MIERTSTASRMPSRSSVSRIPESAARPVGSMSNRSGRRCRRSTSDTSNIKPALQQMQPPATSRIVTPAGWPAFASSVIRAASRPTSPYSLTSTAQFSPSGRWRKRWLIVVVLPTPSAPEIRLTGIGDFDIDWYRFLWPCGRFETCVPGPPWALFSCDGRPRYELPISLIAINLRFQLKCAFFGRLKGIVNERAGGPVWYGSE